MTADRDRGSATITRLLNRAAEGDVRAEDKAVSLLYKQVHDMARGLFRRERPGHTLQATAVADDAFVRMCGSGGKWLSRDEYLRAIRNVMRQVLVDHARKRDAKKRGGGRRRVPLDDVPGTSSVSVVDLFALNEALGRLRTHDPVLCQITILKFFHDMTGEQIARAIGMSVRNVEYKWQYAKAWMRAQMAQVPMS